MECFETDFHRLRLLPTELCRLTLGRGRNLQNARSVGIEMTVT